MPAFESTTRIDFRNLQVLVSALSFDAETQRRAVASRKVATVESVGKDRLDMRDLEPDRICAIGKRSGVV